ncbi:MULTISPECIES: SDR family oxidoreductase [Streptococcus]|uniref:SDR family oxidoreductase n=1 Tax=Streptococcus parauberis TaxID=1348 RepID=A0AAE4L411_9STRE|nr:SDR family oxidoreductase [Streptococcus parauberis]KYP20888.1 Levodione reductase [Streptococcus parauberis]KYP21272.1 Levodione reductase [Streptococcus parauberis]KYP22332.1 Levodione reductase [Streptococcus parauberis]KYP24931.1 Levodione reductase [Streptococcus parauberis]KYP25908.1 Levodione reductase [Streptococcus parauberis]
MKKVVLVTGAGQISLAITRRIAYGCQIVLGDKSIVNAQEMATVLSQAGFDVVAKEMDLSDKESILDFITYAQNFGEIHYMINGAGVSPSQASIEKVLAVDLYGTAVLLEEVGKIIAQGGRGVTISSQSGFRMPALTEKQDRALAMTDPNQLLDLDFLQVDQIENSLHAYQLAKRANEKRVMGEAVKWGKRGARINAIAPGIIVTPLALDEFNGPRGDFYKNMFANSPAGRPGAADEVANLAELVLSEQAAYMTGSTLLIDGGATASYFYGPLQPNKES